MELQEITAEVDLTVNVASWFTGAIDKTKIEEALVANGYTLPIVNKVSFHLYKIDINTTVKAVFQVTWFPNMEKYGVIKLDLK